MILLVAADKNWAIGRNGELLVRIPADHKRFRQLTEGGTVIFGRKTLMTLPQGQPLELRDNIVLSRDINFTVRGARMAHSVEEVLEMVKDLPQDRVFVVGGESIYRAFLPHCDTAMVTRIDYRYQADAYFPNLDASDAWEKVEESDELTCFDLCYHYVTYRRTSPD
ncbi:MAG: dihydrofolate reductase [Lachnospiraceae bacterium]|nr:dihydrofolate reductase [Lachnospiraceae bacterium]